VTGEGKNVKPKYGCAAADADNSLKLAELIDGEFFKESII
jgi:hypothetical protein